MNIVSLASPFGTIRYRFHSKSQVAVSLLEPEPVVVNGVRLEGVLQFALTSHTWVYLNHDSYIHRTDNHKPVSEAIQHKLTAALTTLLNNWHRSCPDDFKAIQADLLADKLKEEEVELDRLVDWTKKQSAVVADLRQQLERLTQPQQTRTEAPQP